MAFYRRIKELREDSDKLQSEVARYLETTAQYYGKYESGERELPFSRAIKLAEYYDGSLDYLAGRTNESTFTDLKLNADEINIAVNYRNLTERNKGKVELFIEQLLKHQEKA